MVMKERIHWIDTARGFCMCLVLLYHSQARYMNNNEGAFVYVPFYTLFFFFVSGYMFPHDEFCIDKKFKSLVYKLFIPYLIISTVLWIPKQLIHISSISWIDYVDSVIGGRATWFIAAFLIGNLLFLTIRYYIKNTIVLGLVSLALYIGGYWLHLADSQNAIWCYKTGMMSVLYMYVGFIFRRYEEKITLNWRILLPAYIIIIYIANYVLDWHFLLGPYIVMSNLPYFLIENIVGFMLLTAFFKVFDKNRLLEYVGKNSIAYYFFNGGIVIVCSFIVNTIFNRGAIGLIIVWCMSLLITTLVCLLINKYIPFLFDIRKIRKTR